MTVTHLPKPPQPTPLEREYREALDHALTCVRKARLAHIEADHALDICQMFREHLGLGLRRVA